MELVAPLLSFALALIFGLFFPRLPLIVVPRLPMMKSNLAPHPEPQPVNIELVAQLLLLNRLWKLSFPFALIPFGLGLLVLSITPSMVGFGLLLGGGWALFSRFIPDEYFSPLSGPYSRKLIREIEAIRRADLECCSIPTPQWETSAVRCAECRVTNLARTRPDLGRIRNDGTAGFFRLLLLDGHSVIADESAD